MSEGKQDYLGWRDGLPTGPDVEALCRKWPDLKVGDRIEYEEVGELLKIDIGGVRWNSVTNQWRKRLEEKGLDIQCDRGKSFYVRSDEEISVATHDVLGGIGRKARKHRRKLAIAVTQTQDDGKRNVYEHQGRLMHTIDRESKKAKMNLLPSTNTQQPPAISPPKVSKIK
jgi:hypothetical protein